MVEQPLGSGSFVLSEWKRGSSMVLGRNPRYWQKGEDGKALPSLDAVRFEITPSTRVTFVVLNNRPKLKDGSASPLVNVRLRQAPITT